MSRFLAYRSNMPPGADPDGGASDSYTCEECGGSFTQGGMEDGSDLCKQCARLEKEQVREQDAKEVPSE